MPSEDGSPNDRPTRRAVLSAGLALSASLAGCNESGRTATPDLGTPAPVPGTPTAERDPSTEPATEPPAGTGSLLGPWPTARADPANRGRVDVAGPRGEPSVRWRAVVALSTAMRAAAGPDGPVATREDGLAIAYDTDGQVRWQRSHPAGFDAAPVVAEDGTVVLAGADGTVLAYESDGAERWRQNLADRLFAAHSNDATPLRVAGDVVLVAQPRGRLAALALTDGTIRWSTTNTPRIPYRPAVADGTAVVSGGDGSDEGSVTVALSLADGTERWRRSSEESAGVGPGVFEDGVVTAGTDGRVVVREATDGTERWRADIEGAPWVNTVPVGFDGRVWVGTLSGGLYALADGAVDRHVDVEVGATPAVGDGLLYVADTPDGIEGRYRGRVVALDGDGAERWRTTVRGGPLGQLRHRGGRVVLGSLTGAVESLAVDGSRAWRAFARRERLPEPVVGHRALYCGNWRGHVGGFGTTDGVSRHWGTGFDAPAPGTPAVTDRGVLAGSHRGEVTLRPRLEGGEGWGGRLTRTATPDPDATPTPHVDAPAPEPRWERLVGGPVGSFGYGDGAAYLGSGTEVVSLSPDGSVRWRTEVGERVRAAPAVGEAVYASTVSGTVVSLDHESGEERWRTSVGERATAPVLVGGDAPALVGTESGLVQVWGDGSEGWRFETGPVRGAPAVVGPLAVVGDEAGVVHCVEDGGTEHWRFETGGPIHGSPALGRDRAYVGSRDGSLYALSLADGSVAWRHDVGEWVDGSPVLAHGAVFVVDASGTLSAVVGER